jgi:hypothetical protein
MYIHIVMHIVMYNKSALKRTKNVPHKKCSTQCTVGTTLEVISASAWKAQLIGHQMYITVYICNVHCNVHCNVQWMQNVQTLNVHWMYIVLRTLSCKKCIKKGKKWSTQCTVGTTLEVTSASAWKAQLIGHQMYITLYICNVHYNVHWMQIVQTLNVHWMYIVLRTLSCKKCIKKGEKCTKKCTLGTTLKVTSESAWKAQLMCQKFTVDIHRWRSNVHCTVHKMYIECTSDEAICCMYNVHKKCASKKSLKVHCKYYKSTS